MFCRNVDDAAPPFLKIQIAEGRKDQKMDKEDFARKKKRCLGQFSYVLIITVDDQLSRSSATAQSQLYCYC